MKRLTLAAALLPLLAAPVAAQTDSRDGELTLLGQSGQLSVAGYDIDIDQVRLPEAGGAVLSGATLTRPGRDGHVLIRQIEVPDTALLAHILAPASACNPGEAASGTVLARDVRFRPDTDLGVAGSQEEIRIPLVTIETSRIGCSWRMTGLADGVVVSGVDGSRIDIVTVETRLRMSGDALQEIDARVDMMGMSLTGAEGTGGFQVDEMGFSLAADLSDKGLPRLLRSGASLPDLMAAGNESVTRGGFYMRGLEMVPGLFLPQRDLERLRLDPDLPVSGDIEFSASVELGKFRLRASSDLSGLVTGEFDLSGALPAAGAVSIPEAISGAVPVPAELIGVSVDRATVRYEDRGAGAVIEHLAGRSVQALVSDLIGSRVERIAARLPGGLPATVGAGWGSVTQMLEDGRGSAGLRPEQPFSLLELAVSGMMGPGMAASRTGAWSEN